MSDEESAEVEARTHSATSSDAPLPTLSAPLLSEEDGSDHDKNFFVFSSAGKPIYSYHGDEESLSSLMATAKALLSVAESRSESLRYIRRGHLVIAFLDRSPLCLVATSLLAEPPAVLRMQLSLVHGQLISLLTASAIKSIFNKSPGFDVRRLLGNADALLNTLITSFTSSPAALLGAYPTLPLTQSTRSIILKELHTATVSSNSSFGLLISKGRVVALVSVINERLQQWDVLLLLNFLHSHESLKQAETLVPICLPMYNPNGHLHAYISSIEATRSDDIVLMLLAGGMPDVHAMSLAKRTMIDSLYDRNVLEPLFEATDMIDTESSTLSVVQVRDTIQAILSESTCGSVAVSSSVSSSTSSFSSLLASPNRLEQHRHVYNTAQHIIHFAYKLTRVQQFIMTPFRIDDNNQDNDTTVNNNSHTTGGRSSHPRSNTALFTDDDDENVPSLSSLSLSQQQQQSNNNTICSITVAYSQLRASMFDHAGEHISGPLQTFRVEKRKNCTIVVFCSTESELYVTFDSSVNKNEAVVVASELQSWLQSQHPLFFFPPIISSSSSS